MVLDLRPGFPAKTLEEFTAYAKTHSLTSGSAGVGSIILSSDWSMSAVTPIDGVIGRQLVDS